MAETTSRTLPILPLPSGVVLPGMVVTIGLESDEARSAVEAAGEDRTLVLVPRINDRFAAVGVVAHIEDVGALPDGSDAIVIRAERRVTLRTGVLGTGSALWVEITDVVEPPATERTEELATAYRATARSLLERIGGRRLTGMLRDIDTPSALADTAGWWPDLAVERKVELLETIDVDERLEKVTAWTREALGEYELAEKIRTDVTDGMEKQQREFLLRQQLAAIRKELGDDGDEADAADAYRSTLAEMTVPDDIRTTIEREIDKLERTNPQQAEYGWITNWLDTITELPWGIRSDDALDLAAARAVLDADHTGLDEVKDRIVEELAVRKLRIERGSEAADSRGKASILALVGPPGVGKTSLGESVARALGREFVRVALGGVRDEAEIRGHRRTYVGAQPGRIVRALTEAGTMNPVFLLDEIDKVGSDWRGDPSSALLEVLDPAQNHSFRDHYTEVDLDLSDVLFIATANVLDTIPGPLLDRMEVITLDGYTDAEKAAIARDHLLDRQIERNGLRADDVVVTDDAITALVEDYTREAGVRNLERQLGKVLRKAATTIASRTPDADTHTTGTASATDTDSETDAETEAEAEAEAETKIEEAITIDVDRVAAALGRPRFRRDEANDAAVLGVVNGLAVTGAGGDVLIVEATSMDARRRDQGQLTLTGQLGDVMSESGNIALSYIRSRRDELGIPQDAFDRRFHVHFPAGAIPKDGPSAGVAMTTALVSLLTGRPVTPTVAMTGEVTLQGKVLPIGGVKQKLLAAHRAGIRTVLIPAANEPDLDDVPDAVLADLSVHPVAHVSEALAIALAPADAAHSPEGTGRDTEATATKTKATATKAAKAEVAKPKVAKPKVAKPKVTKAEVAKPKVTKAEVATTERSKAERSGHDEPAAPPHAA